jgi:hypothetical protein
MMGIFAAFGTLVGVAGLLFGVITEYRQSRDPSISVVPTIPHAFGCAMLLTISAAIAGLKLRAWVYPLVFLGSLSLGLLALRIAGRRKK